MTPFSALRGRDSGFDLANVVKAFQRVLRAMTPEGQGPPKHSIYGLRHTFATTLLAGGAP